MFKPLSDALDTTLIYRRFELSPTSLMGPARGTVIEVEVDHRKVTYAEFVRILGELNAKILSRDGFWPLSKYKVLVPRKNARELIRLLEEAQRSEV